MLAKRTADFLAFSFVMIILAFASAGPLAELVDWVVGLGTEGFEELSSSKRRIAVRKHWMGQLYRSYDNHFLSSTGMLLGLPIIFYLASCCSPCTGASVCNGSTGRWHLPQQYLLVTG